MRTVFHTKSQEGRRRRRHLRVRKKVQGTPERPRLVVFRSAKHIYAQVVDDRAGRTLLGASDRSAGVAPEGSGKTAKSYALGQFIATRAKAQGITQVVFDRGGFKYHGRIKAVADGARKGGLEF